MKKLFFALSLVACTALAAAAQDDYKKGEFFIGYSNGQVDTGLDGFTQAETGVGNRTSFNGFNAAGVYNFNRYVGVKGDVSGTYNSTRFSFPVTAGGVTQTVTFNTQNSLYNVLGGIQIKDNSTTKTVKPFAHALGGLGMERIKVSNVNCVTTSTIICGQIADQTENGLAGAFGGGLDIRLSDRVDLRAVQLDYNPIMFGDGTGTSHNFRIGVGIVIK